MTISGIGTVWGRGRRCGRVICKMWKRGGGSGGEVSHSSDDGCNCG